MKLNIAPVPLYIRTLVHAIFQATSTSTIQFRIPPLLLYNLVLTQIPLQVTCVLPHGASTLIFIRVTPMRSHLPQHHLAIPCASLHGIPTLHCALLCTNIRATECQQQPLQSSSLWRQGPAPLLTRMLQVSTLPGRLLSGRAGKRARPAGWLCWAVWKHIAELLHRTAWMHFAVTQSSWFSSGGEDASTSKRLQQPP